LHAARAHAGGPEEGREVDAEGERDEALRDTRDEAGERLALVIVEAHPVLERCEHRLITSRDSGFGDRDRWPLVILCWRA
jgi:hypothetical protein